MITVRQLKSQLDMLLEEGYVDNDDYIAVVQTQEVAREENKGKKFFIDGVAMPKCKVLDENKFHQDILVIVDKKYVQS
jgi:hypothetical protein